jgi:TolB-like protein
LASTGVPVLDNILAGGYPEKSAILVEGFSSNEKETLGYEFIRTGLDLAETCLYVTRLSQGDVVSDAKALGIDLDKGTSWMCPEGGDRGLVPEDLASISFGIKGALKENVGRKVRVVFDLTSPLLMENSTDSVYKFLGQLLPDLKRSDTVLVATVQEDLHQPQVIAGLELLFDGVLEVKRSGETEVEVKIKKMRGIKPTSSSTLISLGKGVPKLSAQRIAVLPFVNLSPDPGDEYFADGMTEEMISTLSTVGGLTVISRTSSMQYKGAKKSLVDIGRELGAGTLLEGSVRKAGNRVRITLQLLDSSEDKHLWAHNYDRDMGDVFAIQSEVAQQVADSLVKGVFQGRTHEEAPDLQAYTLYIRAKQLLGDVNEANLREALSLFTKATELDPTFARAFAGVAEAWFKLGVMQYEDFGKVIEKMRPAAKRSIELGPNLAEPHYATGILYEAQDFHEEGTVELKKAVQLNPNLAEAYSFLGVLKANLSNLAEAIGFFEKRLELDPLSINAWLELSGFKRWAGMKVESFDLLQKTFQLYPKNPATHLWGFADYYMWYEDYPKAQKSIDEARALGAEEYDINGPQGILYALTGKKEKVTELIRYYKELMRTNESAGLSGVFQLSAMVGDFDEAFKCLDRMAEKGAWGPAVKFSKYLAPLRADPRYVEFCKKVRIPP